MRSLLRYSASGNPWARHCHGTPAADHLISYVQEAGPILLKAVVGVVLGLGEQGMQPRICFHPGECWPILTLVGFQRILAGVGISRTVIGRFGCARSRPPQCLCGHAPRARSTGPVRLYFTSPRRTSSMAMMVDFLEEVGSRGRAPPCNCRARLAATMMNRYMLCSASSGMVQWALLRGALSAMMSIPLQTRNVSRMGRISFSILVRRTRSARTMAFRVFAESSRSRLITT